jgi:integrase
MGKSAFQLPPLKIHKGKNLGYIRLNGKFHYLGAADSPDLQQKYRAWVASYILTGSPPVKSKEQGKGITVTEVCQRFKAAHSKRHEYTRYALDAMESTYGNLPASELSPKRVKALVAVLAKETKHGKPRFTRYTLNAILSAVRLVLKWASSEELCPAAVWHAAQAVAGFKYGETGREQRKIHAVPEEVVMDTLPHLKGVYAAAVQVIRFTGGRPSEILNLRKRDIDRTGSVWTAHLEHHKTACKGHERILYFGSRAQAALRELMLCSPDDLLFTGIHGKSILYTDLGRAIREVCKKHGIPVWTPYQLRHLAGTKAREVAGLDGTAAMLGHRDVETSKIYGELDATKAVAIAAQIG